MDYIINHKRFKKKYSSIELNKIGPWAEKKISKFPNYVRGYFDFFNGYAKKNYKLIPTKCLCGNDNDILLAQSDRHGVEFPTVVCKECGLIRAKDYFTSENVKDFYANYYRNINVSESDNNSRLKNNFSPHAFVDDGKLTEDPQNFWNRQMEDGRREYKVIEKFGKIKLSKKKVLDLGGAIGGILEHFKNENEVYLADYFDPFLNFAKKRGFNVIKGGLDQIEFKPDIVILSHVMEHWDNFEEELEKLIRIQKKGETINYIEFPGVDSIKLGRREGNVIGDIHVPHVYYFTSYVFENIMNRHGFEKRYIDSEIKSIFIYTGRKSNLVNNYPRVLEDLILAERKRKIHCVQNFVKLFIPPKLLTIIRKIRNKKINF